MGILDVIKGIEQLQNLRGSLCNIILNLHLAHETLFTEGPKDNWTRFTQILAENSNLLGAAGIRLTIAPGKRHQKLGSVERQVVQIKHILLSLIRLYVFVDFFDIYHKVSLISLLINERPTFYQGHKVYTPNSLDSAVLRKSQLR